MAIQRQDIGQLGEVQARRASTQTASSAFRVGVDEGDSFVNDLFAASGDIAKGAAGFLQQKVDEDKVKQQQRALMGLSPTEDATTGGARAHMLVGAQNTIMDVSNRLKADATTFQGSDDDWEQHVADTNKAMQEGIFESYPELRGDKHTQSALTNMFLEQSPQVAGARSLAKIEVEHTNRLNTMRDRIILETQDKSPEEISKILPALTQEGVTMQLTDAEVEKLYQEVAVNQASTGDTAFVDATKDYKNKNGVSLYERNGDLQGAAVKGRKVYAQNHAEEVAGVKEDLLNNYMQSDMTFDEFDKQAGQQNDTYGESAWSVSQILAAKTAKAKSVAVQSHYNDFKDDLDKGKLIHLTEETDKNIKSYSSTYVQEASATAQQYAANHQLDDTQTQALVNSSVATARVNLGRSGIIDKKFDEQIKSIATVSPDQFPDGNVEPAEFKKVMDQARALPKDMLTSVVGPEQAAFIQNYQDGLDLTMTPAQAVNYAQKSKTEVRFNKKIASQLDDTVESVVDDVSSGSWLTMSDNLSDVQREHANRIGNRIVYNLYKAGYRGDSLESAATDYLKQRFSMVDGVAFEGSKAGLAHQMKVSTGDIGLQFKGYFSMHKQEFLDKVGVDEDAEDDFYWDVDTTRGFARLRYGSQEDIVSDPISLNELGKAEYARAGQEASKSMFDFGTGSLEYQAATALGTKPTEQVPPQPQPVGEPKEVGEGVVEAGETREWNDFTEDVQGYENSVKAGFNSQLKVWTPYDSDTASKGVDTIAYGHLITKQEWKDGYIEVDGTPIRFRDGESQLNEKQAQALFKQDMDKMKAKAETKFKGFNKLSGGTQRAVLDMMYNAGPDFMKKNPSAAKLFKKGDFEGGFRKTLDYINEGGKRMSGLFHRRLKEYNMVAKDKATEYRVNKDGSFEYKDSSGWHTAVKAKKNSLHASTKVGKFDV